MRKHSKIKAYSPKNTVQGIKKWFECQPLSRAAPTQFRDREGSDQTAHSARWSDAQSSTKHQSPDVPGFDEGKMPTTHYFIKTSLLILVYCTRPSSFLTVTRAKYTPLETLAAFQVAEW
jgi:hypothetical protein